ncbi:CRISPR-associated protein Csy1 [Halomonadaceae bacterium LMG 33818]|uniref:type I-F CRISPR-associated protein Csy1 n=1 Tax=Cernens ardua TaxID=3402176 RepID=UPI003EDC11BC
MPEPAPPSSLREAIEGFIHERFSAKAEKLSPDDPQYLKLQQQYEPQAWLADAAKRVSQLQVVTHSLKAIHSDAKGTNLYVDPSVLDQAGLVGSHCLPSNFGADVVGDAKVLYVYKFLKTVWEEKSLLERALENDEELIQALSHDSDQASEWVKSFAGIMDAKRIKSSHTKGKQMYWLVGDEPTNDQEYRILAPLYSTALIHSVHANISESRFGEDAKNGRKARKDGKYFDGSYTDYPRLALQKLGGANPQNVSQLNSERGGQNYLLASLPPEWQSRHVYAPMRDAFQSFGRRPMVWRALNELVRLLERATISNMHIRDARDDWVAILVDELMLFTFDIHGLAPGWSNDEKCELVPAEQYWLDPGRALHDVEFREARNQSDWHSKVSLRAANWLNERMNKLSSLGFGDAEHKHWSKEFSHIITAFRRQLDDLEEVLITEEEELDDVQD